MHEQLIQTVQAFITISEEEKKLVEQMFLEKTSAKGEFFLREGNVCREVGFINKGLVRYFINKDGEELIYDFGKEGNFMCNYESFLNQSVSLKNIQFIEDTSWLSISYNNLQHFYKELREGEKFGRLMCEHIFVDALSKITSLYTHTPEQRYQNFLTLYPHLQQRIPQYYVSSFVGVKPESLSRIRKRMAEH